MLTLARVLQGLGGGGLMTLSQALIGETIPPRERARYQGYLAAVMVGANTFGPVAGGYLDRSISAGESIFLVNVPIGLGAMCAHDCACRAPRRRAALERPTPGGLVLFVIFVATTLLALEQAQHVELSRTAARRRAARRRASIALVLLVRHENRAASPLIPLELLRQPAIWRSDAHGRLPWRGAGVADHASCRSICEVVRGASPSETGLLLLPLMFGIGAGSMMTGRLVSRTGLHHHLPVRRPVAGHGDAARARLLGAEPARRTAPRRACCSATACSWAR